MYVYCSNIVQLIAHILKCTFLCGDKWMRALVCVVWGRRKHQVLCRFYYIIIFPFNDRWPQMPQKFDFIILFSSLIFKLEIVNGESGCCLNGFDHMRNDTLHTQNSGQSNFSFPSIQFKNLLFEIFNDFRCRLSVCDLFGNRNSNPVTVTVLNCVNECVLFHSRLFPILNLLSINKTVKIFF